MTALLAVVPGATAWAETKPTAQTPTKSAETNSVEPSATVEARPVAPLWTSSVELYGFAPLRTTGQTTVNGFSAQTDVNLGEAIPLIDFAFSLRGSVEKGRLGLLTDLSYLRLGAEQARTIDTPGPGGFSGRGEVTTVQGIYDIALSYRAGNRESALGLPRQYTVKPYAGVRVVQANLGVTADLNDGLVVKEGSLDKVWVQPLIGTQASAFLSPRLQIFARADIAGFGLSGSEDLSGNAQVGLAYAVGNNTQLRVSWRYFGINYDNGKNPDNGFSSYQNGLEFGVKMFF